MSTETSAAPVTPDKKPVKYVPTKSFIRTAADDIEKYIRTTTKIIESSEKLLIDTHASIAKERANLERAQRALLALRKTDAKKKAVAKKPATKTKKKPAAPKENK